jgi:hypothetical protein
MNLFERFIAQKAVNDHDPWNLETHRLNTRRFEYEPSLVTKFTTQKGIHKTLNVLAWVGNISNRVKSVGDLRSLWTLVWMLMCK